VFTFEDYDEQILLVTERVFCNNTKANGKILFCFCRVNQGVANFRFGLQKYVLTAAFYSSLKWTEHPQKWDVCQMKAFYM